MENLEIRWRKLNLSNEEENEIIVDIGMLMKENKKGKKHTIGKLHADRSISKEIIRNTMLEIWRTSKNFQC